MADPLLQTGGTSAVGIGQQTARETEQSTLKWLPYATVVGVRAVNVPLMLPVTVGSRLFPRAGTKGGYYVAGAITAILDDANWADILAGLHPGGSDDDSLPWYTIKRQIGAVDGQTQVEKFVDCRINSATINFPAGGYVTGTFTWLGRTASDADYSSGSPPSVTEGDPLICSHDSAAATIGGTAYPCTNVSLAFDNMLRGINVIGSQVLYDVTVQQRSVRAAFSTIYMGAASPGNFYRGIYYETSGGNEGTWEEDPVSAALVVTAKDAAGSATLTFNVPEMVWLSAPIEITPGVIEYVAAGDLTVSDTTAAWTLTYS